MGADVSACFPVCVVAMAVAGADPATSLARHEFTQIRMGVPVTITVYAPTEEVANTASSAAYARLRDLNLILSDYDPDSELMRLCRASGPGKSVKVSPELFEVLTESEDVSRRCDGAFDVTVGPIVQLWRKARRTKRLPPPDELAAARKKVGYRHVKLDAGRRTVELALDGMRLDLGGIAKGFAADETLKVLKSHGLNRALVAIAGDVVAGDAPPGQLGWRVGVGPLENAEAPPKTFLRLANAAVSTSGDAFQFVEFEGVRYSHLVDPKTGYGLTRHSSVTVVARDGITADSLSSAVTVLGAERGLKLVGDSKGAEVWIAEAGMAGETSHRSPGFAKLLDDGK